jgi:hypothetical protein
MIDIGKKITSYFCKIFENVPLSAIMTQKKFFWKNINMGIKKTQNFKLISNLLLPAFRNAPNKS